MNDNPATQLPPTGELRRIFLTSMDRFAFTGDEQSWKDAQWANRLLTQIHQERQEQREREQAQ